MAWARFAFAKSRRMNKQEGFQNRALASALALALISLALAACDSAPPTVGVAETSARPTSAPTQIQTPSPTPPRTSTATPAPAPTPTLLPSPTPTYIPATTPTATPTSTPTPVATNREAVVAQLAETLPWLLSGNSADGPLRMRSWIHGCAIPPLPMRSFSCHGSPMA